MQRRLLVTLVASAAVFLTTLVYVNVVGDIHPEWLWGFVMAGLIVPPVVATVALVLLLQHRRQAKRAGA
jgi:hypothetical protein